MTEHASAHAPPDPVRTPLPLQLRTRTRELARWMRIVGLFTMIGAGLAAPMMFFAAMGTALTPNTADGPGAWQIVALGLFWVIPAFICGRLLLLASQRLKAIDADPRGGHAPLAQALGGLAPIFMFHVLWSVGGFFFGVFS